ncbi:hypothetical protein GcM3_122024 [Golovinomyces cichoracearum]|uniref:Uncharacterized protein n=1 Tax=Golovinomyces cichoracearum TaxID=62708 RepID=A0A420I6Q6_9PEZI|nr:hypothetical protein GcM3_122024 [Golovinomyces cichoracearum]
MMAEDLRLVLFPIVIVLKMMQLNLKKMERILIVGMKTTIHRK